MPEKINILNLLSDILLELNNNNLYLGYSLEYGHKNPLYNMICFGPGKTSNFEIVEQDGGGEGGSEDCYTIIKFNETYYRFDYKYYSSEGFQLGLDDLDNIDVYEVVPRAVVVTQYFPLE